MKQKHFLYTMSKSTHRFLHILDGGTGELLFKKGLPDDRITWSAKAILDSKYHAMVTQCHLDFLNSGSRIITTNNFALTPGCLTQIQKQNNIAELTKTAVNLAHDARTLFYKTKPKTIHNVLIAGSIPPLNQSYRPDLLLSEKQCRYWYDIIIRALHENNVDIFLCETLSCFKECKYAMDIIQQLNTNKQTWISFVMNDEGLLRSKESLNDVIKLLQPYFVDNRIEIISMNCSTPESIDNALQGITDESIELLYQYNVRIGCYANGYEYVPDDWSLETHEHTKTRHIITPQYYYDNFVAKWLDTYTFIGMIGGCCVMFPAHIKYIVDHVQEDFPNIKMSLTTPCLRSCL
eukprot:5559_1